MRREEVDKIGFLCAEHGADLLAPHVPQLLALLRPDLEYRTRMVALEALAMTGCSVWACRRMYLCEHVYRHPFLFPKLSFPQLPKRERSELSRPARAGPTCTRLRVA